MVRTTLRDYADVGFYLFDRSERIKLRDGRFALDAGQAERPLRGEYLDHSNDRGRVMRRSGPA